MSEIRRVKVQLKDMACIEQACKEANLQLQRQGQKIKIMGHKIHCYGNGITLEDIGNGVYELVGDCNQKALEELAKTIKTNYNMQVIVKAAKKQGWNIVSSKKVQGRQKLKLRKFV